MKPGDFRNAFVESAQAGKRRVLGFLDARVSPRFLRHLRARRNPRDAAEFGEKQRRAVVLDAGSERGAGVVGNAGARFAGVFVALLQQGAVGRVVVEPEQVGHFRVLPAIVVDHQARRVQRPGQRVQRSQMELLARVGADPARPNSRSAGST